MKSKYKVGQKLFFLKDNKASHSPVVMIVAIGGENIYYGFNSFNFASEQYGARGLIAEECVFLTKADLLKAL